MDPVNSIHHSMESSRMIEKDKQEKSVVFSGTIWDTPKECEEAEDVGKATDYRMMQEENCHDDTTPL